MKRFAPLLGALALCCSSAQNDPVSAPAPQIDNGQTGSPSYICTDVDCAAAAQMTLTSLTEPVLAPTFVSSSCHPPDDGPAKRDTRPTVFCRCDRSDGGFLLISDTTLGPGCEIRGRGGFCIFDDSDFSGCDPANPRACDDTCAVAQSRLAADAAKLHSAEIRFSRCVPPPPDSVLYTQARCGTVLRVDDQCYTNAFQGWVLDSEPVDCTLSDQEILSPGPGTADQGASGASNDAAPQP